MNHHDDLPSMPPEAQREAMGLSQGEAAAMALPTMEAVPTSTPTPPAGETSADLSTRPPEEQMRAMGMEPETGPPWSPGGRSSPAEAAPKAPEAPEAPTSGIEPELAAYLAARGSGASGETTPGQ